MNRRRGVGVGVLFLNQSRFNQAYFGGRDVGAVLQVIGSGAGGFLLHGSGGFNAQRTQGAGINPIDKNACRSGAEAHAVGRLVDAKSNVAQQQLAAGGGLELTAGQAGFER